METTPVTNPSINNVGDSWKSKLLVGFAISIFVIIVIALVTIGVITKGSFVFEKSQSPTLAPTKAPTLAPITSQPTMAPITSPPTFSPTFAPITSQPTMAPIASQPTMAPIASQPTSSPTAAPIASQPTSSPTAAPIASQPTSSPTAAPTQLQKIGIYSGCYDIAYLYWVTNRWLGSTNDWGECHGVFPQGESYNNSTQSVFFDKYRPDPSIPMPTKAPAKSPTKAPTKAPTQAPTLSPIPNGCSNGLQNVCERYWKINGYKGGNSSAYWGLVGGNEIYLQDDPQEFRIEQSDRDGKIFIIANNNKKVYLFNSWPNNRLEADGYDERDGYDKRYFEIEIKENGRFVLKSDGYYIYSDGNGSLGGDKNKGNFFWLTY